MSLKRWSNVVLPVMAVGLISATYACNAPTQPGLDAPEAAGSQIAGLASEVQRDLAALRRATAGLRTLEDAQDAGWADLVVPGCRESAGVGGMGYHYGRLDYFFDVEQDPAEPEVLLYAPHPDGSLRLVGAEFVLPPDAADAADPPVMFGEEMEFIDDVWQIHVWAWKHNPDGMFARFNPEVSCAGWEEVVSP